MNGLKRLEYRGYDSAGVALDAADGDIAIVKKSGKVKALEDEILTSKCKISLPWQSPKYFQIVRVML